MRALLILDGMVQQLVAEELRHLGWDFDVIPCEQTLDSFTPGKYELIVGGWWQGGRGIEWCQEFRRTFPDSQCVIVIVTDRAAPDELASILDGKADDYLLWPLPKEVLRLRLRVIVERARHRALHEDVQRKLRETAERFKIAVEGANDGLWDAFADGQVKQQPSSKVWFSNRFIELLGYSREEFPPVFGSWEKLLHPDDHDRIIKALADHVAHRVPYDVEYRLLTKSGQYRWFSARGQATWNDAGQVVRMAGSLRDIQQAKEYERKLEESEEKWRSLVENAPEIVVLTDLEGTIQYVNRGPEISEAAKGRSVYEYVDPGFVDVTREAYKKLVATGEPQSYEAQSQAVGGGFAWYATRLGPVRKDDKIDSVVLIATNITLRRIAEDQLERERNALRRLIDLQERERRLVSYDIHDGLVQYLTAGLLHLEASAGPPDSMPPDAYANFQRGMSLLREALEEGRRLIGDLRPPILDERGVVEAIRYLVSEFKQDIPELQFIDRAHCGRLSPPLEVAIFRITQEALSNIRKHSETGRAQVELVQHGDWLRLIVKDWGKGFNLSEVREDRYGLQGIQQRARLLGTRAIIESKPGEGTTIVVDFQMIRAPSADETGALSES